MPSLGIVDEDIVISFMFPFSNAKVKSYDKIEIVFKCKGNCYLETINFVNKNRLSISAPPR